MLGAAGAAPQILCSVLDLSLTVGQTLRGWRMSRGNEAGKASGAQILWGGATETGILKLGEKEAGEGDVITVTI